MTGTKVTGAGDNSCQSGATVSRSYAYDTADRARVVPVSAKTTSGVLGYGWLGGKQRSTADATVGFTLMGARLYNPQRGLFTSVDPVPGGNTNAYTWPNDPVNEREASGRWGVPGWAGRAGQSRARFSCTSSCENRSMTIGERAFTVGGAAGTTDRPGDNWRCDGVLRGLSAAC